MSNHALNPSARLRALAAKSLGDTSSIESRRNRFSPDFRDGAGQLREVDRYLIARLADRTHSPHQHAQTPDVLAWRDVLGASVWTPSGDAGAFASHLAHSSIETWTEIELACLHAAAWIDIRNGSLSERTRSAARWLMSELQPDNATGRPWATHVFLALAAQEHDQEAAMYAETLIHNTLIAGAGTPEPLCAAILLDSADWLDLHRTHTEDPSSS